MCGIAGAYSFKNKIVEQQWLQNAATSLNKRGPDNQNFVTIGKASLVHARLSIIDTSESANQPQYDASGRYAIIFNGEIFNYQTIRNELLQKRQLNAKGLRNLMQSFVLQRNIIFFIAFFRLFVKINYLILL